MKTEIVIARITWVCYNCLGPIRRGEEYKLTTFQGRVRKRECKKCLKEAAS